MSKKNILVLSYLFPNVSQPNHGIFVFNRLNALSEYVNIKVINPIPWSPVHQYISQYKGLEAVPYKTKLGNLEVFHPRYLSIPKFFKGIESWTYTMAVNKVLGTSLNGFDFDVVDLHWTFPDLAAGVSISKSSGKPLIVTLRGLEAFHYQDNDSRQHVVKRNLLKADRIIALSKELADTSINAGAFEDRHTVIINGADTNKFRFLPKQEARDALGLDQSSKIILMVGSLIRRKGFDLVIKAIAQFEKSLKNDLKLYIVGSQGPEGDFRQELHELVKENGLQDIVVFQGAVSNAVLPKWYASADVFCLASRGEGSPNVLSEALSCGCPVVATNVGAVQDILSIAPESGECVPSDDVKAIGHALQKRLKQKFDREMSAQIYTKYDWDWCAKEVLKVYETVWD